MEYKRRFSVGDFAKLARVTQVMLHHYDKIGLLSPISRGENNYRYYSIRQLTEIKLIRTMQDLGMSLREIKALKLRRTPDLTLETLKQQIAKIDERVHGWESARKLISALIDPILSAQGVDESAIVIEELPSARMVLGSWNVYGEGENGFDALVSFYNEIGEKYPDIDMNYPVWGLFTKDNVLKKMSGKHTWPERYYFYTPNGTCIRPAGLYAIGYARGDYGQNDELYVRMRGYIIENGFEVNGDSYEEYPLNEISVAEDTNYLMRVMINVRAKKTSHRYNADR